MLLNFNITFPGVEDVEMIRSEMRDDGTFQLTVEMPLTPHIVPRRGNGESL